MVHLQQLVEVLRQHELQNLLIGVQVLIIEILIKGRQRVRKLEAAVLISALLLQAVLRIRVLQEHILHLREVLRQTGVIPRRVRVLAELIRHQEAVVILLITLILRQREAAVHLLVHEEVAAAHLLRARAEVLHQEGQGK